MQTGYYTEIYFPQRDVRFIAVHDNVDTQRGDNDFAPFKNDVETFIEIVHKYEVITELTPEVMNELIDRIEIHAPDKSSGHRKQTIDIYFRFNVASASAEICTQIIAKRKRQYRLKCLYCAVSKNFYCRTALISGRELLSL